MAVSLEMAVCLLLCSTTLFYTSVFNDHFLVKGGLALALCGVVVGVFINKAAIEGQLPRAPRRLLLAMGAFAALALLSLARSQNPLRGVEVLLFQLLLFGLCLAVAHHYRTAGSRRRLVIGISLLGWVVSTIGLLQLIGIQLVPLHDGYQYAPLSTLGNPNFVAHYLELVIPINAALLLLGLPRSPWLRILLVASLTSTLAHLVVTESRAGWVATLFALGVLFLLWVRRQRRPASITGALAAVVLLLALPVGLTREVAHEGSAGPYPSATERIAGNWNRLFRSLDEADFSRAMRVVIWSDTANLIADRPWLGVGPGNFEYFLPAHTSIPNRRAWKRLMDTLPHVPYYAHNEYLEMLAEVGVAGLVCWLVVLGVIGLGGVRTYRALSAAEGAPQSGGAAVQDRFDSALAAGILCALSAALLQALFSFNLQDPVSATHFWVLAGLLLSLDPRLQRSMSVAGSGKRLGLVASGDGLALLGCYLGLCVLAGDYYYFRGRQLFHHQLPNRAILSLRDAVSWRGHEFRHGHMLGQVALQVGRLGEAEAALRSSLVAHPHNSRALRLLGETLLAAGRGAEAISDIEHAIRLDPLNTQGYELLGRALRQKGDHTAAVQAFRQAVNLKPDDHQLLMSMGIEYMASGAAAAAVTVLERAALLGPGEGIIWGNLGAAYLRSGRRAEAETALRRALQLDPANRPQWQYNLAQLLDRDGRRSAAVELLRQAATQAPNDDRIASLLRRLQELGPDRQEPDDLDSKSP